MGDLLSEYFPPLIDAIFAYNGTIERFVGDAIFAVFGSPDPDDEQHKHAVRAALEMQKVMSARSASRTTGRLTPSVSARSRSASNRSPVLIPPDMSWSRMKASTRSEPVGCLAALRAMEGRLLMRLDTGNHRQGDSIERSAGGVAIGADAIDSAYQW